MVELLVVIVIMGVLLVMLLPAAAGVRQRASGMSCVNNLKQIGVAIEIYADEHDGLIPRVSQLLGNYLDNPDVFVCPKDKRDEAIFAEVEIFPVEERFKYSYSTNVATPPSNRASDMNGITSEQITVVESDQAGIEAPGDITLEDVTIRHSPVTYALHFDGHVQGYTEDQLARLGIPAIIEEPAP